MWVGGGAWVAGGGGGWLGGGTLNLWGTIEGGGTWWSTCCCWGGAVLHSTGLGEREGEQVELVDIGLYCPLLFPLEPFPPQAPVWLELELAELQLEDCPDVELAELQFPVEAAAEPGEANDDEEAEEAEEEEEDEDEEISGGS